MGEELLQDPEIAELCRRCSDATGLDLGRLLVQATEDELRLTQNAQPALCFTGVALSLLLRRRGILPAATAGHSVGEYAALCAGGAISPEGALRAVVDRGRAMAEAVPAGETTMAAVLGLPEEAVSAVLRDLDGVWPANLNTPTQVVIAGTVPGVEAAQERLRAAGARRVMPLNVSAAFHTPLMRPAAGRLREALDGLEFAAPTVPVVANVDALPYEGAAGIPDKLETQLYSPVMWRGCVQQLGRLGCDVFIELGPKRALTGMMRELVPGATAAAAGSPSALAEIEAAVLSKGGLIQ